LPRKSTIIIPRNHADDTHDIILAASTVIGAFLSLHDKSYAQDVPTALRTMLNGSSIGTEHLTVATAMLNSTMSNDSGVISTTNN
jgi:hypothetical protein